MDTRCGATNCTATRTWGQNLTALGIETPIPGGGVTVPPLALGQDRMRDAQKSEVRVSDPTSTAPLHYANACLTWPVGGRRTTHPVYPGAAHCSGLEHMRQ